MAVDSNPRHQINNNVGLNRKRVTRHGTAPGTRHPQSRCGLRGPTFLDGGTPRKSRTDDDGGGRRTTNARYNGGYGNDDGGGGGETTTGDGDGLR